jgi:hypothetical protein
VERCVMTVTGTIDPFPLGDTGLSVRVHGRSVNVTRKRSVRAADRHQPSTCETF